MLATTKFNLVSGLPGQIINVSCWGLERQALSWLLLFICLGVFLSRGYLSLSTYKYRVLSFFLLLVTFYHFLIKKTNFRYILICTLYSFFFIKAPSNSIFFCSFFFSFIVTSDSIFFQSPVLYYRVASKFIPIFT